MELLKSTISNVFKNILRNKLINFLSLGIIAFTLLIFGIFNYLTLSLKTFTEKFSKNIDAIFYFKDDVGTKQIDELINRIKESLLVQSVEYKSKQQANLQFTRDNPELQYILSEYKESPFPASIEVKFKGEYGINTQVVSFIEDIENLTVIESKLVNIEWARQIITINKFISALGLFLSLILIFVSAFIIFNVIKLNIVYREDEIHLLKLVGASDWYIRFPFIIEGGILGLIGSMLSGILLFGTITLFPMYASFVFSLLKGMISFNKVPTNLYLSMILLGTSIGLFSSLFSIKRFLKH